MYKIPLLQHSTINQSTYNGHTPCRQWLEWGVASLVGLSPTCSGLDPAAAIRAQPLLTSVTAQNDDRWIECCGQKWWYLKPQNAPKLTSGVPPRIPLGSLQRFPRPIADREGLAASSPQETNPPLPLSALRASEASFELPPVEAKLANHLNHWM